MLLGRALPSHRADRRRCRPRNHRNSSDLKCLLPGQLAGLAAVFGILAGGLGALTQHRSWATWKLVPWRAPSNRRRSCRGETLWGVSRLQPSKRADRSGATIFGGNGNRCFAVPDRQRLGQAQATRRQGRAPLAPHQPHGGEPHPHLCPASSPLPPSCQACWSFARLRSHAARWCTASRVQLASKAGFWLLSCICLLGNLHLSKRGWCDDESGGPSHTHRHA